MITCEKCGSAMIERENRKTGSKFLGCSNFPRCRNTARIKYSTPPIPDYVPFDFGKFTLSEFQEAILEFAKNPNSGNAIIRAAAGAAKSTTLKMIAETLPRSLDIMYATFDKRSTETAKGNFPPNVTISTFHSYGFRQVKNHFPGKSPRLNENKMKDLITAAIRDYSKNDRDLVYKSIGDLLRIIGTAKNLLLSNSEVPPDWNSIADDLGIVLNGENDFFESILSSAWKQSIQIAASQIDFDDMIFLPAAGIVSINERHDLLLCDESQDLNACQIILAKNAGTRAIIVGDENQAIYLFRGAASDSMQKLQDHFNATPLPLSICYRCSLEVIDFINRTLPEIPILPFEKNQRGSVQRDIKRAHVIANAKAGDFILCRINAPLARLCFDFIRAGKPAIILGRKIGEGLITMLSKSSQRAQSNDLDIILPELRDYVTAQSIRLTERGKISAAEYMLDQYNTIFEISDNCASLTDIIRVIENLFSDNNEENAVILSTVHKAKGQEAENVYILQPEYMPLSTGDQQEESNIMYVAFSRAKVNLFIMEIERRL
jgi:DNA helicase II / ATP-dependent DNA helicase PcrA